jgi:hypothetical protein
MEDTHIIPGYIAYSFRVDHQKETEEEMMESLIKFILKYDVKKYIGYTEIAAKTKKLHIQACIWFETRLTENKKTAMRNFWQRPKGGISLAKAKNMKSLVAYVTKDDGKHIKNLTEEEFNRIPSWETDPKKVWMDKLEIKCKALVSETNGKIEYVHEIINYYTKNHKAPPTRNTLYKYLLRYHPDFGAEDYVHDLGMFREKKHIYNN